MYEDAERCTDQAEKDMLKSSFGRTGPFGSAAVNRYLYTHASPQVYIYTHL